MKGLMSNHISMREVSWEEYWDFVKQHKSVVIEDVEVELKAGKWEITSYAPPKDYKPNATPFRASPIREAEQP